MAIPRSFIRKLAGDNQVYMAGLSLSGQSFSHTVEKTIFANLYKVTGTFGAEGCYVELEIDNEHQWIEKSHCSCADFTHHNGCCKHIIATLLKVENNFFSGDFDGTTALEMQVQTDTECQELLNRRAEILLFRSRQRALFEKASLIPQISLENGVITMGLKAGYGRGYVVRDLDVLYQSLLRRKTAPCGRVEQFLYAPENFQNEEFVRFFMAYFPLCEKTEGGKSFQLTPEAADAFFALCDSGKVSTDKGVLTITDEMPAFTLWIKTSPAFYRLSLDERDFDLIFGRERIYIKFDKKLCISSSAYADSCGELLRLFANNLAAPIVAKEDMSAFYSVMLKPASKYIRIKSETKDFIPPALSAKIYIDKEGHQITARTEFGYENEIYPAFMPDRDLQTVWDIEGEAQIENLIKEYFPHLTKTMGTTACDTDDDSLFRLVSEGIPALGRTAVLYISETVKNIKLHSFPAVSAAVRMESGLLKMNIETELSPAVLSAALSAYRQKKHYIRLKNGDFLLLQNDAMQRFGHVADGVGISSSELKRTELSLPAYRALYLDSVTDIKVVKDKSFTELVALISESNAENTEVSQNFKGTLRDYQKHGLWWLETLSNCGFGGILADDMGLGKTVQVLALLANYKEKHDTLRALVVCPASLVLNWEYEAKKFTPHLKTMCILGGNSDRKQLINACKDAELVITSYDMLKRDVAFYEDITFDFEIIDEAQYIKNHNTQNAKSVKMIRAYSRFALTGTPIENGIAELWSIFDYLMPGYLYSYSRFRRLFEVPVIREGDKTALSELKKMTSPFILRRLKRDVLQELPEKTETVLHSRMSPEQEKLYFANLSSMHQELSQEFAEDKGQNRIMVLAMLMRLRQICCDPALLYENYKEESSKMELCINLIESTIEAGHKLLVFSQFTGILDRIGQKLRRRHIPYYLLQGSTPKEDRLAQVAAFNQDDTPVFLISLKAGGTGLNLTGADVVIHYDPWWNLSVQNQATDRAHRIGQKNKVTVYKLIAKNTIEEKILELAEKKQSLADNVLPDENVLLQSLTKEQILELFKP